MQCNGMQCKAKALCVSTKGWDFFNGKKPVMTLQGMESKRRLERRQKTPH
jgi:hypothetical protein